jgi:hypothetical protein
MKNCRRYRIHRLTKNNEQRCTFSGLECLRYNITNKQTKKRSVMSISIYSLLIFNVDHYLLVRRYARYCRAKLLVDRGDIL